MNGNAAYYIGLWVYRCIALIAFFISAYLYNVNLGTVSFLAVILSLAIGKGIK